MRNAARAQVTHQVKGVSKGLNAGQLAPSLMWFHGPCTRPMNPGFGAAKSCTLLTSCLYQGNMLTSVTWTGEHPATPDVVQE
jgi:hypothetical protein